MTMNALRRAGLRVFCSAVVVLLSLSTQALHTQRGGPSSAHATGAPGALEALDGAADIAVVITPDMRAEEMPGWISNARVSGGSETHVVAVLSRLKSPARLMIHDAGPLGRRFAEALLAHKESLRSLELRNCHLSPGANLAATCIAELPNLEILDVAGQEAEVWLSWSRPEPPVLSNLRELALTDWSWLTGARFPELQSLRLEADVGTPELGVQLALNWKEWFPALRKVSVRRPSLATLMIVEQTRELAVLEYDGTEGNIAQDEAECLARMFNRVRTLMLARPPELNRERNIIWDGLAASTTIERLELDTPDIGTAANAIIRNKSIRALELRWGVFHGTHGQAALSDILHKTRVNAVKLTTCSTDLLKGLPKDRLAELTLEAAEVQLVDAAGTRALFQTKPGSHLAFRYCYRGVPDYGALASAVADGLKSWAGLKSLVWAVDQYDVQRVNEVVGSYWMPRKVTDAIRGLHELESLELGALDASMVDAPLALPRLLSLTLHFVPDNRPLGASLLAMRSLKRLDLRWVRDFDVAPVAGLPSLVQLQLDLTESIDATEVFVALVQSPSLRVLALSGRAEFDLTKVDVDATLKQSRSVLEVLCLGFMGSTLELESELLTTLKILPSLRFHYSNWQLGSEGLESIREALRAWPDLYVSQTKPGKSLDIPRD